MTISRFLALNTGLKMPTLGFGTFLMRGDELKHALDYALCLGYRHIDTAALYDNEEDIGQVIKDRVESGKLKRKDLFITTKIPPTHMKRSDVLESAEKSLHNLRTSYIDMLLLHHPWARAKRDDEVVEFEHVDILESWDALSQLFTSLKASNIGVSNFTVAQLERIIDITDVPLANVQLECHVYLAQKRLKEFCDLKKIVVSAYAPLGAPNRPSRHQNSPEQPLKDPVIVEIAKSYKKTPAQILLNHLIKRGLVVLPKSSNMERIKENHDTLSWTLTTEDMQRISSLDKGVKFFKFLHVKGHPEFFENEDF